MNDENDDQILTNSTTPAEPTVNDFHRRAMACAKEAALWAVLAGIELLAAKEALGHGKFTAFVEAHCAFCRRTASNYMRAAERAIEALGTGLPDERAALVARIAQLLENDGLDETRAALVACVRLSAPHVELPPVEIAPRAAREPRTLSAGEKALRLVKQVRGAEAEFRDTLFQELRSDFEAWLSNQQPINPSR